MLVAARSAIAVLVQRQPSARRSLSRPCVGSSSPRTTTASCASSPRCWRRSVSRCCRSAASASSRPRSLTRLRRERAGQGPGTPAEIDRAAAHSPTTSGVLRRARRRARSALGALRERGRRRAANNAALVRAAGSPSPTAGTTPACWRPCEARRTRSRSSLMLAGGQVIENAARKSRLPATTRTSGCRAKAARAADSLRGEEPHQPSRPGDARDCAPGFADDWGWR